MFSRPYSYGSATRNEAGTIAGFRMTLEVDEHGQTAQD
jgi:hypothetical protein